MKTFPLAAIRTFSAFTGNAPIHADTFSMLGFQGNFYGR